MTTVDSAYSGSRHSAALTVPPNSADGMLGDQITGVPSAGCAGPHGGIKPGGGIPQDAGDSPSVVVFAPNLNIVGGLSSLRRKNHCGSGAEPPANIPSGSNPTPDVSGSEGTIASILSSVSTLFEKMFTQLTTLVESLTKKIDEMKALASAPATASSGTSASTGATSGGSATAGAAPESPLLFADKMKSVLKADSNGLVSETELRRGVVFFQLYQKSPTIADRFNELHTAARSEGLSPTAAVERALKKLVEEKKLEQGEANWVYSLSFKAASLSGKSELSASGGVKLDVAIQFASATLAGIQSGAVAPPKLTL